MDFFHTLFTLDKTNILELSKSIVANYQTSELPSSYKNSTLKILFDSVDKRCNLEYVCLKRAVGVPELFRFLSIQIDRPIEKMTPTDIAYYYGLCVISYKENPQLRDMFYRIPLNKQTISDFRLGASDGYRVFDLSEIGENEEYNAIIDRLQFLY